MKREVLSQFGHPELILMAFLLFFFSFLGICVLTYLSARKKHFETMSNMPLMDHNRESLS